MKPVYTIDDSHLTIRDVAKLRKAGTAGDLDTIIEILNRIVITPDGTKFEDLNHRQLQEITVAVLRVTNGTEVPNSSGS